MSDDTVRIDLDMAELERIERELGWRTETVIRRMAFELQREAQKFAKVETGALRASIYTNTQRADYYAKSDAAAKAKNPKVETAPIPMPKGDEIAVVGASVLYAAYVEMGLKSNPKYPKQPYLRPAAEKVRRKLEDGSTYKELFEKKAP